MSMPKFPEISPEITCDHALNMILASIAMEELALSHIVNAEGEKLQYVLGTLETSSGREPDIDEVLAVNHSINCLLDSVTQNQMILKSKMDRALYALSNVCPRNSQPICKCSATFKAQEKCRLWCSGSLLHWNVEHLHGECVRHDPCDKSKIWLHPRGRFVIGFTINARARSGCKCNNAAISLQMINNQEYTDIYTVHSHVPADTAVTISMGGIIVEASDYPAHSYLSLRLVSSCSLKVEDSILTIIEV